MKKRNKTIIKIKYPKLLLLIFSIIIAIILFYSGKNYTPVHNSILSLGYVGSFFIGLFYAYGFTAPSATAILLILAKEQSIILTGLIAGLGAILSDLLIFLFIRYSFSDEIDKLEKEKIIKYLEKEERIIFGHYRKYVLPVFAGFLIASPLPSEIGIALIATLKKVSIKRFIILAYLLHTFGILLILLIGNAI
jgi:uncharacterized membrane protein YdjX (TVP38/TMEM64 family)